MERMMILAGLLLLATAAAASQAPSPAGAAAKAATPPPRHRHRRDPAPAAAAGAAHADPDMGPGGVNVTALLLGDQAGFDLASILIEGPLTDSICASKFCVSACRDACHAVTSTRLGKILAKLPANKTDAELAASIYTPDAVLLVTPIAVLGGGVIALEYLTTFSRPLPIPTIVNLTRMTILGYAQSGDVVTTLFDLHITNPLDARLAAVLRGVQQVRLNEKSRITYHTIEYPTWAWAVEKLALNKTITPDRYQTFFYDNICNMHEKHCTGSLKQYASRKACVSYLASRPALAPLYTLAGDNSLCRLFHAAYVPVLPEVHCAHIGPSGGGQCTDDVPFTPDLADAAIPQMTFYSVPPAIQPFVRKSLVEKFGARLP
ncbi:hypothetical protein Rsub_07849 [Raphidocelis subcapitata]|uniref:Uncharacterized protein n=1 Tax=Raphidocelis subcapitata TaxID=307507 RepID=A0A2V0P7G5_9CHLO|nr:hypothetical protein Rsub_07849 [Raphidocelis subcapitata]|eukprot:GBF95499.1 hypothetical protein Rsub_07849 [Raphidocelis subcapitata]